MAAKNTLEIIIKANATQAQAALSKLQTTVGKPFTQLQANVGKLGAAFTSLTGFSLGAAGAFTAVGLAASKAADFIKESVTQTVAYAQQVRELSYVLGTNAEETSRLIQVADDYLISVDKLQTALRFAVKNGFAPTVESIAQLADKFNSISDPTERAAEMVKIFGRNWSALVPMLQAGGDAIRANADAVNDALVLNDAQVQATFEYQQALDNLDDSINSVKTSIGMALVPALSDALGVINQLTPALNLLDDVMGGNVVSAYSLAAALALLRGDFTLEGFAESARILNQGFEASQKAAEQAEYALGDYGQRLKEINGIQKDAGDEAEDAADAVKDYAKTIQKLGLSTERENELTQQFADALSGVDTTALIAANDMELLGSALDAHVITLDQYTAIALKAAQGTGDLDDATRKYLDDSLSKTAAEQKKLTDAIEGTANAATVLREVLGSVFDRTERWEGPRERVRETFEAMKAYLATLSDPQEIAKFSTAMEQYGIAFGLFTEKGLAVEKGQLDFERIIGQVIDPVKAQAAMEAAFRNWKPGTIFDATQILSDAGLLPDDTVSVKIKEEWSNALSRAFTGIGEASQRAIGDQSRATRDTGTATGTSAIIEQFLPSESDLSAISDEWAKVPEAITEAVNPEQFATVQETVVMPMEALATATGSISESAGAAAPNLSSIANSALAIGTNAQKAGQPVDQLGTFIRKAGEAADEHYQNMKDMATAIGDLGRSADTAGNAVRALAMALAGLQSKKVTITVNFDVGAFPSIPGGGSVVPPGYQRNQPRARGGPVYPWEKYLVGEEGPELMIPSTAGTVLPADVTQAAILAAMQGFAPGRVGTPDTRNQERAKERRRRREQERGQAGEQVPFVPGLPVQPVPAYDPRFLGANLDAYMEFFQAANSLAPGIRAMAAGGEGGGSDRGTPRRRRRPRGPKQGGGWTTEVEDVINTTYQQFTGGTQSLTLPQVIGEIETNQGVNAGDAETVRNPNGVVNNYFPISRVDDELDARQLARLVAAEMARMPSR